jgi:hypothetical protein
VEPLPKPSCPEQPPESGSPCDSIDEQCSYGDETFWGCRSLFLCMPEGWLERERPCAEPQAGFCPAEIQPGQPCAPANVSPQTFAACTYGSTACFCPTCDVDWRCGFGQVWLCIAPPEDRDCPEVPPNAGDGCGETGQRCVYGDPCHGGVILFCRREAWEIELSSVQCTE